MQNILSGMNARVHFNNYIDLFRQSQNYWRLIAPNGNHCPGVPLTIQTQPT
jgi:hypothetical protein